jgi:hypothetical protein
MLEASEIKKDNPNNYKELNDRLIKAQESVDYTFSPWLKNKKQKTKNKKQNVKRNYTNHNYKDPSSKFDIDIDFKIGLQYRVSSTYIDILYKTNKNNNKMNLSDDLNIDKLNNSIVIPVVSIVLNKKHNLLFSSYRYVSTGFKVFSSYLFFNGVDFAKSNSKFEYQEYDFRYRRIYDIYNLGIGYKNIELKTTLDDGINIESASSTIGYPYVSSTLKTAFFNNGLDLIGEFSYFGSELYYKIGSSLNIKHRKKNNINIEMSYSGYDYKYSKLESKGNSLTVSFSYLVGFN